LSIKPIAFLTCSKTPARLIETIFDAVMIAL